MLKIDLEYAKYVYELVMLFDVELLQGPLNDLGMVPIGYPEGSGFTVWK